MSAPITIDTSFERISSPLGAVPFDKGLCMRDKIVAGYIQRINKSALATAWGNDILGNVAATYPSMGNFGPGGGPLL
jgi:hypothetical protein